MLSLHLQFTSFINKSMEPHFCTDFSTSCHFRDLL